MQSRAARLGLLVAVIAAAVVLFVVLQGSDDSGNRDGGEGSRTSTPKGPEVLTVRDGQPVGGVKTLTYNKGDRVDLEVTLNQPEEEIHVHGYEIERPAEQSPVRLSFPADLDGVFEIEVHRTDGSEAEIAELRVNP
jgi:FtsP/CotA-like multicopper oxidase with cupredoxin domain